MRLIGVEFENFARFDKCFIPIGSGLTVLVGRNNSGKTAILKGLTALSGLAFNGRSELNKDLRGYLRADPSNSYFDLRIWFEWEVQDPQFIRTQDAYWASFITRTKPKSSFWFRVWPGHNLAPFHGCSVFTAEKRYEVIERVAPIGQLQNVFFDFDGNRLDSHGWANPGGTVTPDGTVVQLHEPSGWLSGFKGLGQVVAIDARRFVQSNVALQTADALSPNAENLAPFLQTLQGRDQEKFGEIQTFLTKVFPEFKYLNPESRGSSVLISLTLKKRSEKVLLSHCGTGVEQMLALASFVVTSPPGSIVVIDEPHSFLHPYAERELMRFLSEHKEHRYIIGTHSPVVINAVSPSNVVHLDESRGFLDTGKRDADLSRVLMDLGYRNSDFLFQDRLVFVEGESDQEILPILLKNSQKLDSSDIDKTGFPVTGGADSKKGIAKQTIILKHEKMLEQIGRATIPRVYLRDGDAAPDDKKLLIGTRIPSSGGELKIRFLPKAEIEDYLLVSAAIVKAMEDLANLEGVRSAAATAEQVQKIITVCGNVKGSKVLETVFDRFGLAYSKRTAGRLIAQYVSAENQPDLSQIVDLVRDIF